jgi:hypothetical protein
VEVDEDQTLRRIGRSGAVVTMATAWQGKIENNLFILVRKRLAFANY